MSTYQLIDLFAGAGGLSSGFSNAGFKVVAAVENVEVFCKTHQYNFPKSISLHRHIQDLPPEKFQKDTGLKRGDIDVVIGSPPCQTFSTIGHPKIRSLTNSDLHFDPRNYLYEYFFQYVKHYQPSMFLMENVPTMKTKYGGSLFNNILNLIRSLDYKPHEKILNSVQYGVPQMRKRLFMVGARGDIEYSFPKPTHYWSEDRVQTNLDKLDACNMPLKRAPTVYDAIGDLPKIYDGCREDELPYSKNSDLTHYQKMMRNSNGLVRNNICRMSNDRAKKVFPHMKQGSKYMDLPEGIRDILPFREDIFKDRLKRLDESKPSWTILAHIGIDGYMYIHPTENRTLSVREAARIQSFHDSFVFLGNMREQYKMVGNAVPPILAERLADSIIVALRGT